MPPKSRKPSTRAQNTLSFGPHANKITKPTSSHPSTSKKASKSSPSNLQKVSLTEISPKVQEAQPAIPESPSRSLPIRKQEAEAQSQGTSHEQAAGRISETQIRKYWKGKEDERIAPRVHQQGLSVNEKILRHFDLSSQYGPCIGIPRVRRWKRAEGLGLKPPVEVLAVLIKEEKGGNKVLERAFMDGLLTSRMSENE